MTCFKNCLIGHCANVRLPLHNGGKLTVSFLIQTYHGNGYGKQNVGAYLFLLSIHVQGTSMFYSHCTRHSVSAHTFTYTRSLCRLHHGLLLVSLCYL